MSEQETTPPPSPAPRNPGIEAEMLTPSELASLKRDLEEKIAFGDEAFKDIVPIQER